MAEVASTVTVEQIFDHRITIIRINRPEVRNCVNTSTALELVKAFNRFDESETSEIAIFCGEKTFCAGFDLA